MAPSPSHSQSLLANPGILILDRIEREPDRFRLRVHVEQEPICRGKRAVVARFVAGWRKTGKAASPKAPQRIAPKHAAILVTRPADQMKDEQQQLFDRIAMQCPDVIHLRKTALGFRAALTADDSAQLRR